MDHIFKTETITILEAAEPAFTEDGCVNLMVVIEGIGRVPFTASPDDTEIHGKWLHGEAIRGSFGAIAPYERPLPTVEDLQEELDKIWPDIVLGLADEATVELARNLRKQIKVMSE